MAGSIVMGVPQNEWFIVENPMKMDDLGVPLFYETSILMKNTVSHWYNWYNVHIYIYAFIDTTDRTDIADTAALNDTTDLFIDNTDISILWYILIFCIFMINECRYIYISWTLSTIINCDQRCASGIEGPLGFELFPGLFPRRSCSPLEGLDGWWWEFQQGIWHLFGPVPWRIRMYAIWMVTFTINKNPKC